MWKYHLQHAIKKDQLLTAVTTMDVQGWLEQIATHRTADGEALSRESLKHMKHLLSGIFRYAFRKGLATNEKANPVREVDLREIPAVEMCETYAYSWRKSSACFSYFLSQHAPWWRLRPLVVCGEGSCKACSGKTGRMTL